MKLDQAIEQRQAEKVLAAFAEDCVLEVGGVTTVGKAGVRRWLDWMYHYFVDVHIEPLFVKVDPNRFFAEFNLHGHLADGNPVRCRHTEVITFDGPKISRLQLSFDRDAFASKEAQNVFGQWLDEFLEGNAGV